MSDKRELPKSHANTSCSCLRAALRFTLPPTHLFVSSFSNGALADAVGGVDRAENKVAECNVTP